MAPKFVLVALAAAVLVLFVSPVIASAAKYTEIAVGGMVFCKSCKGPGYVDYLDATPVSNVVVRVSCFDKAGKLHSKNAITKGGFFYIIWTELAIFDPVFCRAYADWSPSTCNVPLYYPGKYGSYLYLVEEKNVTSGGKGGIRGSYSPGVIFLGKAQGSTCPTTY